MMKFPSSRISPVKESFLSICKPTSSPASFPKITVIPGESDSIISRWWLQMCIAAWFLFIIFEIVVFFDRQYSENPLCPHSDYHFPEWYWRTNYGVLGGFILVLLVLLTKMIILKSGSKRIPHLVAFNIVTMGTVATILALFFEWGGVCIDVLGVASPAAIWGEWIASGPLLLFITVTIVDKPHLTRLDWFFMITFFLCLVTGFFIIIPQSYGLGLFWLAISCLTYIPVLSLPWYDSDIQPIVELEGRALHLFAMGYAKRYNLVMWLTIVLPLYTVNYLLALFGTINPAQTIVIYQILSVLTKGLFAAATMDIHLDLLFNAEKLLVEEQRANDARRAFMKYIFHEVRNPLNSLSMGIELLDMSTNINAAERESLLMMQSASEFMSDTLDNVLCLQKIEEGKFELEMVHFSFEKVISRVFSIFRGAIVKKNLSLTHDILPLVPSQLVGDVHRIEHVISNLLSNAIKFSSHGKAINVVISCDAFSKKDIRNMIANVTVSIQDEGAGISEEDQAKLFSSFVQIRPGTIQKGQGSGLGLSFCKQMVEFHGGVISVKSLEGHGSKFEFTIPFPVPLSSELGKVDCIEPASSVSRGPLVVTRRETKDYGIKGQPYDIEAHIQETERANLCSISVLVVDDADSNRKMLMMLLKKAGLETDSREDGQQAVDLISADMNAYQLVLMDNFMPVMNGLDAVRNLRARGYPYIIVGITGNSMADDLAEYLASGADMVVSKPLKKRTLDMLIQHIANCGTLSRPEMRLIQGTNTIQWSSRI